MSERTASPARLSMIGLVCVSLFASLFVRLWYLQEIDQTEHVAASKIHLRTIQVEGPRGRILDRNGNVLVDNRVSQVVGLNRRVLRVEPAKERTDTFTRLADTLTSFGTPTKLPTIQQAYADTRYGPLEMVPVATDVSSTDLIVYLAEHHDQFPGIEVVRRTVRTYPYGPLAAQIVGYVGQANSTELDAAKADKAKPGLVGANATNKPLQAGDQIGKSGVEATYEGYLRGTPSSTEIQVDARGNYVTTIKDSKPQPGDDVWLTIDANLQAYAEQLLAAKIQYLRTTTEKSTGKVAKAPQGSVVITDPENGQILAMASYPTYDPTELVNGISEPLWTYLTAKAQGQPLFDWPLQGEYSPGSTFKLATATAALNTGFLAPGRNSFNDTGSYKIENCKGDGCIKHNAASERLGPVNVVSALTESSDVFFYWIADKLWQGRGFYGATPIQDAAAQYGFGIKTGIDLPAEAGGRLPTPASMAQEHAQSPTAFPRGVWTAGDNLNTALGQGDDLVTPLQLANAYATFANGGTRYIPQIVSKITHPKDVGLPTVDPTNELGVGSAIQPQVAGKVTYKPGVYAQIYAGLQGVVMGTSPKGTANDAWNSDKTAWPMAGKTGTAQVLNKADTSVFVGFGPSGGLVPAQYAIAIIIPEAGFGADAAAPLTFSIMAPVSKNQVPAATPVAAAGATPPAGPTTTTTTPAAGGPTTTEGGG
jgi:penicillin-binding protein 2